MLKLQLKLVFRNLVGRKGYTVINLFGLAAGITCCLLIFEYVAYERSYDGFHEKVNRVFRVQDEEYQNGRMIVQCASAMPALAPAMKREYPEVENACRLYKQALLLANDAYKVQFRESKAYYADAAILDIFNLPLQEGDAGTALSGPGKILLSVEEARKYFGKEDPLGKVLTIRGNGLSLALQVTGVFRNFPANSHLKLNVLISYPTYSLVSGTLGKNNDPVEHSWDWTDFYTYVLLRKGTNPHQFAARLQTLIDKNFNNLPENRNDAERFTLSLIPLKDIHLYSHYTEEAEANGDGQAIYFLYLIAFFIIGIAWINYINLATARSLERAREVGVKKVLGVSRPELILQFMVESFLLNLLALVAAFAITLIFNPFFAQLTERPLGAVFSLPLVYWGYFAMLFIFGTFLSGLYPAIVLSRYQPVAVLKGLFRNTAGGQWLRKGLIVGQFATSIILIAGTTIIYRQVHFMRNQQIGADISHTLVLRGASGGLRNSAYKNVFQAFKGDVLRLKGVSSITASSTVMGEEILWCTDWHRLDGSSRKAVNIFHLGVDDDFVRSYGLKLLAGRNFSPAFGMDRKAIILNESAIRVLGFRSPQEAVGRLLTGTQDDMDSLMVVGVVADYHNEGLQKAIQPLVLLPHRDRREFYSIKMSATNTAATIASIKSLWNRYFPTDPYSYFFLDEFFDRQYADDRRFGQVFALFAVLAIAIACFGLLGLSAYNVLQRTKEIGIRKVLGASVKHLLIILSGDFLVLVLIGFAIATPIAWIVMNIWLQGFAYRIAISWWTFGLAGLLALVIAFVTVSAQVLKAVMVNPVKHLRSE